MSPKPPVAKIWIAVDALERSADVLGAVTRLATGRAVELAGLFVEDADLVRLAGWPAATEKRLFESSLRPFGEPELESALRAQALALQRRVDALAREIGVPWSFRTVRGRMVQQALTLAEADDWIVMASASHGIRMRVRQVSVRQRPVLWLMPEDAHGLARLLTAAAVFDPDRAAERRVVLPEDAARAAQVRASLSAAVEPVRLASVSELLGRVACGPWGPGEMALMTREAGAADPEHLRRLLRGGAAPVVLA